jgi:hypothetical protein
MAALNEQTVSIADAPRSLTPPLVHIGVDVGQRYDPTAIVVCEVMERTSDRDEWQYRADYDPARHGPWSDYVKAIEGVYVARHLERLPLLTSYPDVAKRVVQVVCAPRLAACTRRMWIDATGVGIPVYELIAQAVRAHKDGNGVQLQALTFVHGDKYDSLAGRLGKAYLVSRLQALLQTGRVQLPPHHAEAEAMARELHDYEIRIDSQTANDTYGAFKTGAHDDLATALGLACLEEPGRITYGPDIWQLPWE